MTAGIKLISDERCRQIDKEGWTEEHDSQHQDNEILNAALCYAHNVHRPLRKGETPLLWPWGKSWWKPSKGDSVRDLVKAGALIAAEIDRRIKWNIK